MTRVGIAARVSILAAVFALLAPVQIVAGRRGARIAHRLPVHFHRLFLRLFDIRVTVEGAPPEHGHPTLVLANHVSWLDIPVMASLLPLSFIAKQEIADWPVFGFCARLQRCIFLDRTRKAATAEVNAEVAERLAGGDAIVLFPEGTTGDGNRLLPFRSSLVGAARAALAESAHEEIRLQPLAISYLRRNGLPVTRREMPEIAWYGDMELPPHFLAYARGGPLDVVVSWGKPIPFGRETDRKRATALAEAEVRQALRAAAARSWRVPNVLVRTQDETVPS
ncbi:lysophospholipid acyltransferase family protein [Enterovirga aerilata]|uniref:1-acyl-sn-glycerol-3-phosphate acyltransferase n=1 Tax=Enterovirga aerilata TaxID=2730920 RepID=A0A849IDB0_9HYPH|nr:lysophospholipid acyltransferase family protein [Enterovirga sp. DB1703]NNM74409.1 1-acyl-sn-glycerol-3-phosphate acyltransferase [Enterovirga sp. DB1703]